MNVDTLTIRSATSGAVERGETGSRLGFAASVAGAIAAIAAFVVAGPDAPASLVVVSATALAWAVAGVVITVRAHCPAVAIVRCVAIATAIGALCWSVQLTEELNGTNALLADLGQRWAAAITPALAFHLLMTLPNGHVTRAAHGRFIWAGYLVAAATGLALLASRDHVVVWPIVVLWAAVLLAMPVAHANYRTAGVIDQRRMQWIGWAAVIAVEVTLVSIALTIVVGWPHHIREIGLAGAGLIPLALAAGTVPRLLVRIDRLLTHTVSLAGLTALIVVAYLLAIAAFGRKPDDSERTLLLLSMLAAAGTAIAYQPARSWLTDRANRVVYGERVSPDEALRTWGARLTRAIPLDELLLQLAEALRKSMQLRSAQIWVGADGRYEVAAMVPHRTVKPFIVGEKERAVVSRAGVSVEKIILRNQLNTNLRKRV